MRKDTVSYYDLIKKRGASYGKGTFRIHHECCAQEDGDRQTVSMHKSTRIDAKFQPIPGAVASPKLSAKVVKVKGMRIKSRRKTVASAVCQGCNQSSAQGDSFFKKQSTIDNPILVHLELISSNDYSQSR
ncbi:hypothetical protein NP233_g13114 [Leucocoprinus birnbaumii]|uniref:Uncharacterized protein n=1 Tax=Leucocoprinus birnbaumii TaxID=56174 RepID=A0AAD5VFM2_9AGAR|nr:hypothetical protein NP233_g13114 [Leucocoprinus birnbaumii]